MARKSTAIAFVGDLDVEDGEFTLRADRLIVRPDGIAFRLSGRDLYGDFAIDGIASLAPSEGYASPELRLLYPGYDGVEHAQIRIIRARLSPNRRKCDIEGVWFQYGDTWNFGGTIDQFAES
jgi:hypothetical protein